jgi:hypothetical protein
MPMGDVRREGRGHGKTGEQKKRDRPQTNLSVYLKSAPESARHFDLDQSDEHQ